MAGADAVLSGQTGLDGTAPDRGSAVAAAIAATARIAGGDHAIHAFVAEPDRAGRLLGEAQAADWRWPATSSRPSLFAVPVGVKDVIRADGLQTRAGSDLPPEILAGPEATVVRRLRAAGALVAGKTVTAEFAMTAPGPTRNPHDRRHTPGGSSSGSAAAVAAGLVPLALGTQTLASVIRPAAYCGVAGFRATHGRIPVDGVIAYAPSLDAVGCLAPDAGALATAAAVLCDGWLPAPVPPGSIPVLAIPAGAYLQQASPHALAAFRSQVAGLAAAGLTILEIPAPADPPEIAGLLHVITRYEAAQAHAAWFAGHGGAYQHATAQAIREGQLVARRDYDSARARQASFRAGLTAFMQREGIDAWLTPAATGPAPAGLESTGSPVMSMPWSLAGCPAVSVPAGWAGPLPLGLQCIAAPGRDEYLLHWAAVLERALGDRRGWRSGASRQAELA